MFITQLDQPASSASDPSRRFCKPLELRTLDQISADVLAQEEEKEGLPGEIAGGGRS